MTLRGRGRLAFAVGFAVLLLDGAAAIWLGQLAGRGLLVGLGLVLVAAALGLAVLHRRWVAALTEVEVARAAVERELDALRRAAAEAHPSGPPPT